MPKSVLHIFFRQANTLPEGRVVRLPTEFEWQCAASGGDPKRKYPWLGGFAKENAKTDEGGLGRTSPVGLYPDGKASCGAGDMAGNVLECCANRAGKVDAAIGEAPRALRGGSWFDRLLGTAVGQRVRSFPVNRTAFVGYQVSCASPSVVD